MADGNRVWADSDFFDQQAHEFLTLCDIEALGARVQSRPEMGEGLTHAQITGLIDGGRLDRLPLRRDRVLLRAERRHPSP